MDVDRGVSNETLIGVTMYNGEPAYIVEVVCPRCGGDRLEPVLSKFECLQCGEVFATELP
jgi:predicted RNA-binding Zn-ribbon protein involved in translation (DUF1610 family)